MSIKDFDFVIIGSGPAGQKAALQARQAGASVVVIERERTVGGHCVHYGTIPSKTLRETTLALDSFRARGGRVFDLQVPEGTKVESLMTRLERVIGAHVHYISDQLGRTGIQVIAGRAQFLSPKEIEVVSVTRERTVVTGKNIVVATGSRPRQPTNVPVDHEHILDSDSILSITYLPRSITILGAGVIASEYASIFAALGVEVTMVDRRDRPLGFLDRDLTDAFEASFRRRGGVYFPCESVNEVTFDGLMTHTYLESGKILKSEKLLCALGRVANLEDLHLENAGLEATARGLLKVDQSLRTSVPHIYAVGDVIGPPSLASSAMEQGRRAACHALGLPAPSTMNLVPAGIYTIPEMSAVGLTEEEAVEKYGGVMTGFAHYEEIARGHVAGVTDGLLKLVCDAAGERVLGIHIVGEGATELIHVGQMGLLMGANIDTFVENTFNFPTFAECYRVAALNIVEKRTQKRATKAA